MLWRWHCLNFWAIFLGMSVFEKIIELFNSHDIKYELIEHEPVYTSEDAAKIRDTKLSEGAKALVFIADKAPILVVCPGDKRVDTKAFKIEFKIKDLSMATREKVKELTTLEIGSIPPTGSTMSLKTYFDSAFKDKDMVSFNAGAHTKSIRMRACDLIEAESPIFGNYAK